MECQLVIRLEWKFLIFFSPYKENLYLAKEYKEFFQKAGFVDVCQKKVVGTLLTIGTK